MSRQQWQQLMKVKPVSPEVDQAVREYNETLASKPTYPCTPTQMVAWKAELQNKLEKLLEMTK